MPQPRLSHQRSVVIPQAGANILERIKGRQVSMALLQAHAERIIQGHFPLVLQHEAMLEQLDLKGTWRIRRVGWTAQEFCVGNQKDDGTHLVESIPLHEITEVKTGVKHNTLAMDFRKALHLGSRSTPKHETSSFRGETGESGSAGVGKKANTRLSGDEEPDGDFGASARRIASSGTSFSESPMAGRTTSGALSFENINLDNAMVLKTIHDGFNCGRSYVFRLPTESESATELFVTELESAIRKAQVAEHQRSKFEQSQQYFRDIWASVPFQAVIASFIALNFLMNCAMAQLVPDEGSRLAKAFDIAEICFTAVFALELSLNAYAHWFWPFITDPWSVLDITVVAISIVAIAVQHLSGFSVLRLTRAFRILRLFGRLKVLKKIITGLMMSILPVINAFLITAVVTMIYGIVGVAIFRDESEDFDNFARAMYALFLLVVGESWVESIPAFREDGTLNHEICIYVVSYVLIVTWTLLQVGVAVLLDNYISATNVMEMEAAEQRASDHPTRAVEHIVDPLLSLLSRTFDSSEDLSKRIEQIFSTMDVDESGDLSMPELMTGLKRLNIEPKIHASAEDIDSFFAFAGMTVVTNMRVDKDVFEKAIRVHLHDYSHRMITDTLMRYHQGSLDPAVTTMTSFKTALLLLEQMTDGNAKGLQRVEGKLDQILERLGGPGPWQPRTDGKDSQDVQLLDFPSTAGSMENGKQDQSALVSVVSVDAPATRSRPPAAPTDPPERSRARAPLVLEAAPFVPLLSSSSTNLPAIRTEPAAGPASAKAPQPPADPRTWNPSPVATPRSRGSASGSVVKADVGFVHGPNQFRPVPSGGQQPAAPASQQASDPTNAEKEVLWFNVDNYEVGEA